MATGVTAFRRIPSGVMGCCHIGAPQRSIGERIPPNNSPGSEYLSGAILREKTMNRHQRRTAAARVARAGVLIVLTITAGAVVRAGELRGELPDVLAKARPD